MSLTPEIFHRSVLEWFARYGRKNLPWQHPRSPYRVWVSEVMLQQTQVVTVTPYFEKFICHFPTIKHLAEAPLDHVLSLWAGLGYYARARHLHRTAQIISQDFQGEFPQSLEALQALPGIGRSTAGAILALGFNQSAPILDGNVKRILTRLHGISGWPGSPRIEQKLWKLSQHYTPTEHIVDYTQAIMDFGALICVRTQPHCYQCPFIDHCVAYQHNQILDYPSPKPTILKPKRQMHFLILINENQEILLEKRPPIGIWGGLWSVPECPTTANIMAHCKTHYACQIETHYAHPPIRHTFSHFHLDILPVILKVKAWEPPLQESSLTWLTPEQCLKRGVAAPVKKLLTTILQDLRSLSPLRDP